MAVSHHLDDDTLSRVTSGNLLLLDAQRNERRAVSRWLWPHDRGRHPCTSDELRAGLERRFDLSSEQRFTLYHHYVIWVGFPR